MMVDKQDLSALLRSTNGRASVFSPKLDVVEDENAPFCLATGKEDPSMEKYANVFTYNRRTPRSIEHFEHVSNCFWLRVETKKEQPTHAANKHRMFEERILNRHRESQKVSGASGNESGVRGRGSVGSGARSDVDLSRRTLDASSTTVSSGAAREAPNAARAAALKEGFGKVEKKVRAPPGLDSKKAEQDHLFVDETSKSTAAYPYHLYYGTTTSDLSTASYLPATALDHHAYLPAIGVDHSAATDSWTKYNAAVTAHYQMAALQHYQSIAFQQAAAMQAQAAAVARASSQHTQYHAHCAANTPASSQYHAGAVTPQLAAQAGHVATDPALAAYYAGYFYGAGTPGKGPMGTPAIGTGYATQTSAIGTGYATPKNLDVQDSALWASWPAEGESP